MHNVFSGPHALLEYLSPEKHPPLPLVELPPALNPYAERGVRIFAKCMFLLPLGNIKSIPARQMLLDAAARGALNSVHTLIENSSGNTVFSLATLGRLFGIPRTRAIVSHEVSKGKLALLRLFGTEIEVNEEPICPDPRDATSGIYKARVRGAADGWCNPGQYDNPANPAAHEQVTGPQLYAQLGSRIDIVCVGLGTTGTIVGIGTYLKSVVPGVRIIGAVRAPNNPVPGVRTKNLLSQIAFPWNAVTEYVHTIGTKDAFRTSLALVRAGILGGPSSGFALAGLLAELERMDTDGSLDAAVQKHGELITVFICPDGPLPYIDEYFEYLDPGDFPRIEHEELLARPEGVLDSEIIPTVDALTAHAHLYEPGTQQMRADTVLLDVRSADEFLDVHLPGALHIPHTEALAAIDTLLATHADKRMYVVCASGRRSALVTQALQARGAHVVSLEGGIIAWSEKDLPRVRPQSCMTR
ncbi:pyridoxal-phosphate dependent enzyme [Patescibacteria group bacterium]|nr:pyridoxal-phosphate dependent enzyme [Patescibacteria group bacterium]